MRCVAIAASASRQRCVGRGRTARAAARARWPGARWWVRGRSCGSVRRMPGDCRSRLRADALARRVTARSPSGVAASAGFAASALQRQRARVERVARRAGRSRRPARPPASAAARRSSSRSTRRPRRRRRRAAAAGGMQHQHELAARAVRVGGQPGRQGGGGHRRDGLELLGQLAARASRAARRRPRPARAPGPRCGAAPRTAPRRAASRQRLERGARSPPRPAGSRRRRSRSRAGVAGHADSAASALLAPGSGSTRWPAARAAATSAGAGVAHRRRAGIADVGHALAARQPLRAPLRRLALVVLVHRQQRLVDAEVAQQARRVARVLAGHRVDQRSTCSARSVMSARLPIGVATTYSAPAGYCCAPAAARAACSGDPSTMRHADATVTR